jgi:hypothetical protein
LPPSPGGVIPYAIDAHAMTVCYYSYSLFIAR